MELNKLKTSEQKSVNGVWVSIDDDTDLLIGRYGNRKFQKALNAAMAPYKQAINRGTLSDAKSDQIMVDALVEGILLGWKGITLNGEELPYSKEAATKLLLDKSMRDFRELVVELSQDAQAYRDEEVAENEGKSEPSSNGTPSGESEKTSSEV